MSQFPDTLEKSALLQLAAACIASGHPLDRIALMAIWPLGKSQNTVLDLQDHFEALIYILGGGRPSDGMGCEQSIRARLRLMTGNRR